ncbi:glycosyltransferase [Arthrobacter sp. SAFR-044]|uniref:glycosyltransferase n=1 Tax=Arthrobacter sp. SAFR-044 TaxID=3387278 RepID=UPI003F7CD3B7
MNEGKNSTGLNVLLLTKQSFASPRDGGTMRTSSVHGELVRRGINVTTVAVETPEMERRKSSPGTGFKHFGQKARVLLGFGRIGSVTSARWCRMSVVNAILEKQSETDFDCVVIEYTQLVGYLPLFTSPVLLDMHNIESELLRNYARSSKSWLRRLVATYEARRVSRLERRLPSMVEAISAVSKHDVEIAQSWMPKGKEDIATIILAPNGVSEAGFSLRDNRHNDVVFVAHLGWQPNVDAAKWLATEVWPLVTAQRPDLTLRIIGRAPSLEVQALARTGISIHGDVPSVVEYVARARVATAPLLAAGGTRLKILEALSCGTPVVATSLGALGLEVLAGESLAIVDSPADFSAEILRLAAIEVDRSLPRGLVKEYRWPTTLSVLGNEVERLARDSKDSRKEMGNTTLTMTSDAQARIR